MMKKYLTSWRFWLGMIAFVAISIATYFVWSLFARSIPHSWSLGFVIFVLLLICVVVSYLPLSLVVLSFGGVKSSAQVLYRLMIIPGLLLLRRVLVVVLWKVFDPFFHGYGVEVIGPWPHIGIPDMTALGVLVLWFVWSMVWYGKMLEDNKK